MFKNFFTNKIASLSNNPEISALKNISSNDKNNENYFINLKKGLLYLKRFSSGPNINNDDLKEALYCFMEANKLKKNKAEPYFYLSYISYIAENIEVAQKYADIASMINPELPDLRELQKKIITKSGVKNG